MLMYSYSNFLTDEIFSHWAGNGDIASLEEKLRSLYSAKHALCIDSATNGLLYLLLATGLRRQEIMTSSLGYGATISGALVLDCKLHFVDVDEKLNIGYDSACEALEKHGGIKAVIATDFCGNPHDMECFKELCDDYGIWHFVDAAESMGADYGGISAADNCDAMVVSFGSGKSVYAGGEGGAIITNNTQLYNKLVSICQHPHRQERDLGIGMSNEFALNGRMHPLAAHIAIRLFDDCLQCVKHNRMFFNSILDELADFSYVSVIPQSGSTFYHCPFLVDYSWVFEHKFPTSPLAEILRYSIPKLVPLPKQLQQAGLGRHIKSSNYPYLKQIIDKLYFLEPLPYDIIEANLGEE